MLLTIIAALLVLLAVIHFVSAKANNRKYADKTSSSIAFIPLLLAALALAFACTTSVPARSVGVATSFGKPVVTYNNGLHLKAPWWKVHDMDGTIQNNIYNGENQIDVRLANNAKAKVDASVQWRLKTDGALEAFLNYKDADIDKIQSNVIDRNLKASINESMASYDPLNAVDPATGNQDLNKYQEDILKRIQSKADGQVEVISVTIPNINYDDATQHRIDQYQEEVAKTRNAEQSRKTAEQQAQANETLDKSLTDQVNTAKCFEVIEKTGKEPLGCFPGGAAQPVKNVG